MIAIENFFGYSVNREINISCYGKHLKEEFTMSKNYLKMLGYTFVTGWFIGKIYDLGIQEGKLRMVTETIEMLNEATSRVENQ